MDKTTKFLLPSPNFDAAKKTAPTSRPHYLTPSGMTLLPREKQPPPMYGPRGATLPAKFLPNKSKIKKITSKHNETQFCEPCEMELQSLEDLRVHRAQHKRCKIDGCNYNGHPSVMDKHVAALHTSGLFEKYRKLSTPEEIATWREERRKRYPTVANVILRQKAQEQRQKRGERLEASKSRFGKREDRARIKRGEKSEHKNEPDSQKTPEDLKRNLKNVQRNNRRKKAKRCAEVNKTTEKTEKVESINLNSMQETETICQHIEIFKGTKSMLNYKHLKVKKVEVKNALAGLLGMYGSDDDESENESEEGAVNCDMNTEDIEDDEKVTETKVTEDFITAALSLSAEVTIRSNISPTLDIQIINSDANRATEESLSTSSQNLGTSLSKESNDPSMLNEAAKDDNSIAKNESSDEAPEETAIGKTSQIPDRAPPNEPPRKRAKPAEAPQKLRRSLHSGLDYRKSRLRKQNTMLEKLLEPDIRHERNILLQCVRYVCENNFFGMGPS